MAELVITKLSHYSAPCTGGKEIILLCDRVAKDDIQVRFYQDSVEGLIWEAYGDFLPNDVHKQVAISLRTPKYFDESIQQPVTVQIQLRRPSDGCTSLSRSFQLTPRELDPDGLVRKRHKRLKEENYDMLQEYIQLATSSGAVIGQQVSAKRNAPGINFGGQQANKPGSPKDLTTLLVQQGAQQIATGSRQSPFVQYAATPGTSSSATPQNVVVVGSNVRSPSFDPTFLVRHFSGHHQLFSNSGVHGTPFGSNNTHSQTRPQFAWNQQQDQFSHH